MSALLPQRMAFIVGAPRCGTTFVSRHLEQHPDVCFSSVKEPHFFAANDLSGLPDDELKDIVEAEYLDRFFAKCRNKPKLLAEGSVSYLYGGERIDPILRLWPEAKFIICVRDPMKMLPSLHQRLRYTGDETVADFAAAWALVEQRRRGEKVPRSTLDPRFLDYEEIGRLGKYAEAFMDRVGRERCFVSVYDDLAADPAGQYRRVLDFLGLPDDGQSDFSPRRATQGFKYGWLQRALKRPPKATRTLLAGKQFRRRVADVSKVKARSGIADFILRTRKRLLAWNKAPAPRVDVPVRVQREIRHLLREDIDRLGLLIGRDLSHWLTPAQK